MISVVNWTYKLLTVLLFPIIIIIKYMFSK